MIERVGHDKGDGIADMAHLVLREDRIGRTGEGIDLEIEQARQIAEVADVSRGQDQRDAGKDAGAVHFDREFCMRMGRAQHQGMHRRLWRDVIGIAALAADERVVFLAQHALPDTELNGSSHLFSDPSAMIFGHIAVLCRQAQTHFGPYQPLTRSLSHRGPNRPRIDPA